MDEYAIRRKMWSRMSLDFMRKCNIFPILDQEKDDGNLIDLYYDCKKDNPIHPPNWSQIDELTNLGIFMREVVDKSRTWVDKQIYRLRKQGATLTYGKMQSEESSSKGDERTISTLGLRNQDEGQISKKNDNVVEAS